MLEMMLAIRFNNNKLFMHENKADYIRYMREPYYEFIRQLAPHMLEINPKMEVREQKCLSRIYRDTRFSKDKSPYRDHHWIAFRAMGIPKEEAPMFWFEIRIEGVSWGLGFWGENKAAMKLLRERMLAKPTMFKKILRPIEKNKLDVSGSNYKKMDIPDALDKDLKSVYTKKELYVQRASSDPGLIFHSDIVQNVLDDYKAMAPFYNLMQECYEIAKMEEIR